MFLSRAIVGDRFQPRPRFRESRLAHSPSPPPFSHATETSGSATSNFRSAGAAASPRWTPREGGTRARARSPAKSQPRVSRTLGPSRPGSRSPPRRRRRRRLKPSRARLPRVHLWRFLLAFVARSRLLHRLRARVSRRFGVGGFLSYASASESISMSRALDARRRCCSNAAPTRSSAAVLAAFAASSSASTRSSSLVCASISVSRRSCASLSVFIFAARVRGGARVTLRRQRRRRGRRLLPRRRDAPFRILACRILACRVRSLRVLRGFFVRLGDDGGGATIRSSSRAAPPRPSSPPRRRARPAPLPMPSRSPPRRSPRRVRARATPRAPRRRFARRPPRRRSRDDASRSETARSSAASRVTLSLARRSLLLRLARGGADVDVAPRVDRVVPRVDRYFVARRREVRARRRRLLLRADLFVERVSRLTLGQATPRQSVVPRAARVVPRVDRVVPRVDRGVPRAARGVARGDDVLGVGDRRRRRVRSRRRARAAPPRRSSPRRRARRSRRRREARRRRRLYERLVACFARAFEPGRRGGGARFGETRADSARAVAAFASAVARRARTDPRGAPKGLVEGSLPRGVRGARRVWSKGLFLAERRRVWSKGLFAAERGGRGEGSGRSSDFDPACVTRRTWRFVRGWGAGERGTPPRRSEGVGDGATPRWAMARLPGG